ncbi:MAG: neutral zinc metallopeptidase [Bryobacteraceae bacterium]
MRLSLALVLLVCLQGEADPKLAQAARLFDRIWKEYFAARGEKYVPPHIVPFSGKMVSRTCGKVNPGNAYYCAKDNIIYYDEEFLAALRLRVASETGTSGDAAPLIAIAHELGHAVYSQMNRDRQPRGGIQQLNGYGEEKVADCLAGVLIRAASEQRFLTAGTLEEAESTMAIIGKLNAQKGHPSWRVRYSSFLSGYRTGVDACAANTIENLRYPSP